MRQLTVAQIFFYKEIKTMPAFPENPVWSTYKTYTSTFPENPENSTYNARETKI